MGTVDLESRATVERLIGERYDELGYRLGWSLLACPWENLGRSDVALFTLNPGGRDYHPPAISEEAGSAYVVQTWEGRNSPGSAPLQVQVQRLCRLAGVEPSKLLSGYFVPFRSTSWATLGEQRQAVAFSTELWAQLLGPSRPRLAFTLGRVVFDEMRGVLNGGPVSFLPSGWGAIKLRTCDFPGGRLVGLPHLSRFALLGDARREAQVRQAMSAPVI